jgi:hypothetical protein
MKYIRATFPLTGLAVGILSAHADDKHAHGDKKTKHPCLLHA